MGDVEHLRVRVVQYMLVRLDRWHVDLVVSLSLWMIDGDWLRRSRCERLTCLWLYAERVRQSRLWMSVNGRHMGWDGLWSWILGLHELHLVLRLLLKLLNL